MKRGILVYNPIAGQRDRRAQMSALIDRQRQRGIELVNAPTSGRDDATEIVRAFLARGIDLVAVCGGDGTVSEAAAGLIHSSVPLAILPGGTTNVLARELNIPLDFEGAEALLGDGVPVTLRFAYAGDRPFLLWAGVGFDARIEDKAIAWLKRRMGRMGIAVTAYAEFFRYEFPRMEVTIDGVVHKATYAVACRARRYAGDWIIAPDARLDGGDLDVMLFSHRERWRLFRLFQHIRAGKSGHLQNGLARIVRGQEVSIRSLESYAVEVQLDGDCLLETPVRFRVGTETVQVLVPKG
jgi:diacylglycerol kinase (ATP)